MGSERPVNKKETPQAGLDGVNVEAGKRGEKTVLLLSPAGCFSPCNDVFPPLTLHREQRVVNSLMFPDVTQRAEGCQQSDVFPPLTLHREQRVVNSLMFFLP